MQTAHNMCSVLCSDCLLFLNWRKHCSFRPHSSNCCTHLYKWPLNTVPHSPSISNVVPDLWPYIHSPQTFCVATVGTLLTLTQPACDSCFSHLSVQVHIWYFNSLDQAFNATIHPSYPRSSTQHSYSVCSDEQSSGRLLTNPCQKEKKIKDEHTNITRNNTMDLVAQH